MIASFAHIDKYHVPFEILIKRIYKNSTVLIPPPITAKTLEIGSLHSPDLVCVPFKYNLGSMIEALDMGADYIFQAGCCSGCRLDFYSELQEKILHDMGYKFKMVNPFPDVFFNPIKTLMIIKKAGKTVNIFSVAGTALTVLAMIKSMDKIDVFVRANVGFEVTPKSFENLHKLYLNEMKTAKTVSKVNRIHKKYIKMFKAIEVNKPEKVFRVVIIGEIFVVAEPMSNYFIEKQLATFGIEVHRTASLSYLMSKNYKVKKRELKNPKEKGYLCYDTGSDGSVTFALEAAENGFDGVIHLKPFGCLPEVSAMPTLIKIGKDYDIPVLFFSFDSQTNTTGLKTRLEAFHDMLVMKKEKEREKEKEKTL